MFYNFLSTTAGNIKQFVEKYVEIEIDFEEIDRRTDRFLEWIVPFIPWEWLEVTICSHLLSDKAIRIMSKKGYKVFDGDKGRFVKGFPKNSPLLKYSKKTDTAT